MPALHRVVVLYEDQRGPTGGFALHDLVLACLYDSIDGDRAKLQKAVKGIPKKGNSKLLRALCEDLDDIKKQCRHVVAVFDDDKVRKMLGLGKKAKEQEVIAAIKKQLPDCAFILLLKRNMETVVRNIGECDPTVDRLQLDRALKKRSLNDRDLVINQARAEAKRTVRECVLKKNPSLRNIVEGVCGLLVGSSA